MPKPSKHLSRKHLSVSAQSSVKLRAVLNPEGTAGSTFVKDVTISLDHRGLTVNLVT
jgi:hypothetical protein